MCDNSKGISQAEGLGASGQGCATTDYGFDKRIDRGGTGCVKWDVKRYDDLIPLWVADMDFEAAPCIRRAMQARMDHGIFGYVYMPEQYYTSVIDWFQNRHALTMRREWMLYTIGVVPALAAIVQALTKPGDGVLMLTPVYNCFFSCLRNAGVDLVESRLVRKEMDGDASADMTWGVDFDDFERKAALPETKLFLLCNPHNPAGRVWTREELTRMGEICIKHDVVVVSDEIHNELVMPGCRYTPFGAISDRFREHSITCTSASKSFNIAGLQLANICVQNDEWRERIDRQININETCDVNPFGPVAHIAAYSDEGAAWIEALNAYLWQNYQLLLDFFHSRLPQLKVSKLEGTYLVWVDCSALGKPSAKLEEELLVNQHVWLNSGTMYDPAGSPFMRINIACPRAALQEGLERIAREWGNA